jgi:hypothetical protein
MTTTSPPLSCNWRRERTKEILSDSRVQAAAAAERGGRVRDASEAADAKSVTVVGDGRSAASGGANGRLPAAADARAWIDRCASI